MTEATGGMDMGDDPPIEYGWEDALDELCTCHNGDPHQGECIPCGVLLCHFRDELHCHHDGCPSECHYEPPWVLHTRPWEDPAEAPWVREEPSATKTPAKTAQAAARECHAASIRAIEAGDFKDASQWQEWRAYWYEVQDLRFPVPAPSPWMFDAPVSDVPF